MDGIRRSKRSSKPTTDAIFAEQVSNWDLVSLIYIKSNCCLAVRTFPFPIEPKLDTAPVELMSALRQSHWLLSLFYSTKTNRANNFLLLINKAKQRNTFEILLLFNVNQLIVKPQLLHPRSSSPFEEFYYCICNDQKRKERSAAHPRSPRDEQC